MIAEMTFIRMCDPSLSDDPSAMLSRIAALEEKLGLLSLGMPIAPAASVPAPVKKAVEEEKKPAPAVATEKPKTVKSASRSLPYWLELVESLSKENRSAMGMRGSSRGYYDAEKDCIIVKFSTSFAMKLMEEESAKSMLAAMISSREGKAFGNDKIVYELADKKELEKDDLLDTLEE